MSMSTDRALAGREAIADAFSTQLRVIHALVLRDSQTRYGQHKLGFLWAFLEPALMVTMFALVLIFLRSRDPGGMPHLPFMICGIVPFMCYRNTLSQMQSGLSGNRSLLGFPQVTTFDCILAKGLLDVCVIGFVFVSMLTMAHLLGDTFRVERPLEVLAAFLTLALMAMGGGFLFSVITPIVPSVRQIVSLLLGRPLLLGSGVFYTADSVPLPVRDWLLYNPLLHAIEIIRGAMFVQFETSHGSWTYLSYWMIGSLALGLTTHQALRRRAIIGL